MPTVILTSANNTWSTTAGGAFIVHGLAGNDNIRIRTSRFAPNDGDDTLHGGDGND
jgi:hypothetical protein